MAQIADDALAAGREALERHAWKEAYELLKAADEAGPLEPEDLERLAEAAIWSGTVVDEMPYLERAYAGHVKTGNNLRAAYMATMLGHEHSVQLQQSVANGWMSRAKRLLDDQPESPEHGYYEVQAALFAIGRHDFDEAYERGKRAEEIGRRFGDRALEVRALQRQAAALIAKGDVAEGKMLLDEAATAAISGELDPYSTLIVFCNTIGACRDVAEFESAGQWTDRAQKFCEAHSHTAFPGMCRVNYAEVMKYKGQLAEAQEHAVTAGEDLRTWCPRIAGAAFYELGEIRLRLGELAKAEEAFREADEYGREPEPGRSLLALARGNVDAAAASIRRALVDGTMALPAKARLLPAAVEIEIAAGKLDEADAHATELRDIAEIYDASALRASGEFARGSVLLARGDAAGAFQCLKQALRLWQETGATYDVARARELLGLAYRVEGDDQAAVWELQAAAARFERLGAVRDADRIADLLVRDPKTRVMKTFLFTDIVKSTDLLGAMEDRHWANVLRQHDETLRRIFSEHDGQVVDHTGDGFFVAFENAAEAVTGAIEVQRAADHEFPFDIRIGLHTDGALQRGDNYRGRGVHAAARIGSAAQGREILGSRITLEPLLQFRTTNHRSVELKGIKEAVDVCSVDWEAA